MSTWFVVSFIIVVFFFSLSATSPSIRLSNSFNFHSIHSFSTKFSLKVKNIKSLVYFYFTFLLLPAFSNILNEKRQTLWKVMQKSISLNVDDKFCNAPSCKKQCTKKNNKLCSRRESRYELKIENMLLEFLRNERKIFLEFSYCLNPSTIDSKF